MFELLVKLILWIIGKLSSLIILPIVGLINLSLPNFGDIILIFESYLGQYVFPIMAFIKRVMINFGVPQFVFTFIISWYTFKLSMMAGVRIYALIHNLYKTYKP